MNVKLAWLTLTPPLRLPSFLQVQDDRANVEDRLAELNVQHSSLQELLSTLNVSQSIGCLYWHKLELDSLGSQSTRYQNLHNFLKISCSGIF